MKKILLSQALFLLSGFFMLLFSQTFYEQGMNQPGSGITSQVFTDLGGTVNSADDFIVPAGESWTIAQIQTLGSKNVLPIQDVELSVWSGAPSGVPGTLIYTDIITPISGPDDANILLAINPNNPLVLTAGTYWVSVAPILPFSRNQGRWFWARFNSGGSGAVNSEYHLIDPANIFDAGFTDWTPGSSASSPSLINLCFRLIGPDGEGCPYASAVCNDFTVQLDASGNASITPADIGSGSTAECGLQSETLSKENFDCLDIGTNVVVYTITDADNNSDNCTATVTVEDAIIPTAVCQDITVSLDASGNASIAGTDVDGGSSDNCNISSLSVAPNFFSCANTGANTLTLTATDASGNSDNCTATATVEDNVPPIALCQNVTVQLNNVGNASITAADIDNGSNDACGIGGLSVSPNTFGCSNTGANMVTLSVSDINGNTSSCNAAVTVEDNTAPSAVCKNTTIEIQPDGTYTLLESDVYDAANSSDNCSISSISFAATTFGCEDIDMTFPVAVTVEDPSGNSDNCTGNITIALGSEFPGGWDANTIGPNPQGTDYSFDPCANPNPDDGQFTVTGSGANGTNPFADNLAFASQNLCGDFTITTKVESVTPGGYGGIMVRESMAPGSKQFSLFSNLTNILLVQIRTATNAPKQQQLHNRPFPTWLRVQRMGPWLMSYYSPDGINFQYVQAVFMPTNSCLEVGLAAFTNFGGTTTAVFSNVDISGGNALAGSGVPSFVQQGEQLPNSDLPIPNSPELFPNPTSDVFNLAFPQALKGDATATLRNQIGQVMAQRQLKPSDVTTEWNVSQLPSGLYFMEVRQEGLPPQVLRVVKAN
jgi:regulation of enolase protein 1 (concanavalin A-like superfamily)